MGNGIAEMVLSEKEVISDQLSVKEVIEVIMEDILPGTIQGTRVGKFVCLNEAGEALVDYPDNPFGPLPARSAVAIEKQVISDQLSVISKNTNLSSEPWTNNSKLKTDNFLPDSGGNRKVLLMFEYNDPQLPIIIGFMQDKPVVAAPPKEATKEATLDRGKIKDIIIDGERIIFEARKEVVLRCGKGSITMRADGKVVIKGTDLISRSKGMNKVKGAAVRIN